MIEKIRLKRGNVLTKDKIYSMLNSARSTWQYAKFYFYNGKYMTVYYSNDRTVDIATNIRDFVLWNKIQVLRTNYSQWRVADFIFNSINKYNK